MESRSLKIGRPSQWATHSIKKGLTLREGATGGLKRRGNKGSVKAAEKCAGPDYGTSREHSHTERCSGRLWSKSKKRLLVQS